MSKPLRYCKECGLEAHSQEDLELFRKCKKSPYGRRNKCRKCWAEHGRRYRAINADKVKASRQESMMKIRYGIDFKTYDEMFEQQDGKCKICGSEDNKTSGKRFAIDHCHSTGKVRGLLCGHCNTGLGMFADDPTRMLSAVKYLADSK